MDTQMKKTMKSTVDIWTEIFTRVGHLGMGREEANRNTCGKWKTDKKLKTTVYFLHKVNVSIKIKSTVL